MAVTESELAKEIEEALLLVHAAEDRKDDREFITKTHVAVEQVAVLFQELRAGLAETERNKLERALGRRVQDLRRLDSLLPRIGERATSTPDRQVAGASRAGERMITGVSWQSQKPAERTAATIHVGDDIEAWCGTCKESTTHSVFAVVGAAAKVVTCKLCGARHSYRTGPARERARDGDVAVVDTRERNRIRALEEQQRKKQDELTALAREVSQAECIPFDPKRRYRAGELIDHPDLGRGKVETVLRSSLLVRFARGGMKSVMLV